MNILVVCVEGNNRSVTVAQHLKYWNHDVLTAGLKTNSPETLEILCEWADRIIITARDQAGNWLPEQHVPKVQLWDIGPDVYPRPFNPELRQIVRRLVEEHRAEYKP